VPSRYSSSARPVTRREATSITLRTGRVPAEAQLAERGVLCVPDVVANAGGVICAAAEYRGAGHAEAFAEIREKIRDSTAELLDRLRPGTLTPRAAADQIAHERLRQAAALRRKF
jgi:glutamate dehydrogenase (NAD(P)+)